MWILLAAALAGELERVCPPEPTQAVVDTARRVEQSWFDLDDATFSMARHQLVALLPCVDQALTVEQSVQLHRAEAISAFVDGEMDAARRSLAALHVLAPDWSYPEGALPPDHPLRRLIDDAHGLDVGDVGLAVTPQTGWSVDGTRFPGPDDPRAPDGTLTASYTLPTGRAFVLQVFGDDGHVVYTGYHLSTVDIPVQDMQALPTPEELRKKRQKVARLVGTTVGGAMIGGAAVMLGLGMSERRDVVEGMPLTDIEPAQARANVYGGTSAGLASAGATVMAVVWAVRW